MDALDLAGVVTAVGLALLDLGRTGPPGAGVGEVIRTMHAEGVA